MTESLMLSLPLTGHAGDVAPSPRDTPSDGRAYASVPRAPGVLDRSDHEVILLNRVDVDVAGDVEIVGDVVDDLPPSPGSTYVSLGQAVTMLVEPVRELTDDVPPSQDATTVRLGPPRSSHPGSLHRDPPDRGRPRSVAWILAAVAMAAVCVVLAVVLLDRNWLRQSSAVATRSVTPIAGMTEAPAGSRPVVGPSSPVVGSGSPVVGSGSPVVGSGSGPRDAASASRSVAVPFSGTARGDAEVSACAAFTGSTANVPARHTLVLAGRDPARPARLRLQPVDDWSALSSLRPWTAAGVLRGWSAGRGVKLQLLDLPITTVRKAVTGGTGDSWTATALPAEAEVLQTMSVTIVRGTVGCPAG